MATVISASTLASTLESTLASTFSSTFSSASSLNVSMAMRQSVQDITQEIEFTISAEKQVTQAINESNRVQQVFNESVQTGTVAIDGTSEAIDESNRAQQRFNQSAQAGTTAIDRISGAITLANEGIALMERVWSGVNKVMTLADDVTSVNSRIAMINDGTWNLLDLQKQVLKVANDTRASYTATADLLVKAGMGTQGVFKSTQDMLGFAERFNKLLAAGQANAADKSSATLQMSQALGNGVMGNSELVDIENAVPMFANILAEGLGVSVEQIRQMGAEGELTADRIVTALENQEERINGLFLQTPGTFSEAMTVLGNKFSFWIGQLNEADGPLQQITKRIQELSVWLDTTEGMQFFNNLAYGVNIAINIILTLFGVLFQVVNFISSNWSIIEPIVWGIVAAYTAWFVISKMNAVAQAVAAINTGIMTLAVAAQIAAVNGLSAGWRSLNAAMRANIILFIISLIIGLVIYIHHLWKTNDNFAAGVMRTWNAVLNFFDQVPIFFEKIKMAVVNTFWDMSVGALEIMEFLINGVIDGINWLRNKSNDLLGTNFQMMGYADLNVKDLAKDAAAIRLAGDVAIKAMEQDAAQKAAEREQKVQEMLNSRAAQRVAADPDPGTNEGSGIWNNNGPWNNTIDSVGEIGKINDTVDISSEDLKIMRELAEMKNIQNFVTLTPTVSVTTGDIRNGSDADTIVAKIKMMLEKDIASSASAVYG
ncbi:tape measure protein [Desulfitobacterium chlororespirans]|uniref:Tape measure domain-containing protein n=1 Tax=Desulfitobacterium chlororespirans DSM 11544 TaxID=1121395 RepID=A0A1M7T5I6_9FIRM|nr:tape measure protein [Desulfitobacterium chlororespirans]SHN65967.1 tape measure domain-containing protein [Desulfitobacterium chlororespirans DSM 11544]